MELKKPTPPNKKNLGQIVADLVASVVGSWPFILIQSTIIVFWIITNGTDWLEIEKWDPYPFTFLNLTLSFQAAYTAPIIMMSQNRAAKHDRQVAEEDYCISKISEQENQVILAELAKIHQKLDNNKDVKQDLKRLEQEVQYFKNMLNKKI